MVESWQPEFQLSLLRLEEPLTIQNVKEEIVRNFNKLRCANLHNKLIDLTALEKALPTLIVIAQDQVV